jgi:MoaA/NifB/PqqE/SkfB family radical SAM enzyme
LLPAISGEGRQARTDTRRRAGVFEKILGTMKLLPEGGVLWGISLTGTRHNAEEILIMDYETLGQGFIAAMSEKHPFAGET